MPAEFKHSVRRLRGQIIGWSIGLTLYGLMMISLYDTLQGIEGLAEIIASYPPELMAFFGDMAAIVTPAGYLDIYYFSYMTLIIGIFAIGASAGLLVGDEEKGILDLVLAHPISRTALFWGRLLGLVTATIIILLIGWLSWAIPAGGTGLNVTRVQLLQPFLPLLAVLLLFAALALLLSMLLPSARLAGMVTGALLVANFLLDALAQLNEELESVVRLTPLYYYQGGSAIHGIEWEWLAGLLLVAALLAVAAWALFQRRDIRVGGEHSWRLADLWPNPF